MEHFSRSFQGLVHSRAGECAKDSSFRTEGEVLTSKFVLHTPALEFGPTHSVRAWWSSSRFLSCGLYGEHGWKPLGHWGASQILTVMFPMLSTRKDVTAWCQAGDHHPLSQSACFFSSRGKPGFQPCLCLSQ